MNPLFAEFALPELNATLNSVSLVLLIAGFIAIKAGRRQLHIACMLSALAVSTAFLISYLYYHYTVGDVKFGEQYLQRHPTEPAYALSVAYGFVLVPHVILAATVAPLALITAYFGFCNKLIAHKRIAKWTLPIWLYVSITGVVVYWMVYQM